MSTDAAIPQLLPKQLVVAWLPAAERTSMGEIGWCLHPAHAGRWVRD